MAVEPSAPLRAWLVAQAVELSASLELRRAPSGRYSVYAAQPIPARTSVCSIPKRALLSHRTASLNRTRCDELTQDSPHAFRLALCVLHELLLGPRSRWGTYLAHCPSERVPIGILWGDDARGMARGTELDRELQRIAISRADLGAFYQRTSHLLDAHSASYSSPPSLELFLQAYSLVSSRAFEVDAFHTLALVPLADLFDHSAPNQVHFESDDFVCPVCGSLDECEHDGEDGDSSHPPKATLAGADGETCEIVTDEEIQLGQEVFNTYGKLSNAKLIAYYGFALEANELDGCSFELDEVYGGGADEAQLEMMCERVESDGEVRGAFEELHELVISSEELPHALWIDPEANVSWQLWAATVAATAATAALVPSAEHLKQATLALSRVWQALSDDDEDKGGRVQDEKSTPSVPRAEDWAVLAEPVGALRSLIRARIASQHLPTLAGADLLTLVEEQAPSAPAEGTLALESLANERLLLECVLAKWDQIASVMGPTR